MLQLRSQFLFERRLQLESLLLLVAFAMGWVVGWIQGTEPLKRKVKELLGLGPGELEVDVVSEGLEDVAVEVSVGDGVAVGDGVLLCEVSWVDSSA